MNLELADYERSVETLRGQLKEKEIQQVDLEKEISSRERKCEDLNNELGEVNFVMFSRCVALLPLSLPPSLSHCPCPNTIYIHNWVYTCTKHCNSLHLNHTLPIHPDHMQLETHVKNGKKALPHD